MFHVGQMVVCISRFDDEALDPSIRYPQPGMVYTIRAICLLYPDSPNFLFEEIVNPPRMCIEGLMEEVFWGRRFRPVRKTDISALRRVMETLPMLPQGDIERV
jgi:hypothetical protein